jgi:hypothetical protein
MLAAAKASASWPRHVDFSRCASVPRPTWLRNWNCKPASAVCALRSHSGEPIRFLLAVGVTVERLTLARCTHAPKMPGMWSSKYFPRLTSLNLLNDGASATLAGHFSHAADGPLPLLRDLALDQGQHEFAWDRDRLPSLQRLRLATSTHARIDLSVRALLSEVHFRPDPRATPAMLEASLPLQLRGCSQLQLVDFPRPHACQTALLRQCILFAWPVRLELLDVDLLDPDFKRELVSPALPLIGLQVSPGFKIQLGVLHLGRLLPLAELERSPRPLLTVRRGLLPESDLRLLLAMQRRGNVLVRLDECRVDKTALRESGSSFDARLRGEFGAAYDELVRGCPCNENDASAVPAADAKAAPSVSVGLVPAAAAASVARFAALLACMSTTPHCLCCVWCQQSSCSHHPPAVGRVGDRALVPDAHGAPAVRGARVQSAAGCGADQGQLATPRGLLALRQRAAARGVGARLGLQAGLGCVHAAQQPQRARALPARNLRDGAVADAGALRLRT